MPIIARLNEYASLQANDFDEVTLNQISFSGVGTCYADEFCENVGISTVLTATQYTPYNVIDDEFGGYVYSPGSGSGTYMRFYPNNVLVVYNEIDEVTSIT